MTYDVLINYCGLDPKKELWSKISCVSSFSRVLSFFRKEIQSHEYFVYVRKNFYSHKQIIQSTNFKLISNLSYTFAHYPRLSYDRNYLLLDKFKNADIFHDRSLLK